MLCMIHSTCTWSSLTIVCTYLFVYYYSYLYSMLTVSVSPYISSSRCYDIDAKLLDIFINKWNVHIILSENCTLNLCLNIFFLFFFSRYVINIIFCCSQIHLLCTCIDFSLILTSFFRKNHCLNVVLFLLSEHLGKIIVYILCSQLCITIILHKNYDLKQFVFFAGDKVSILVVQQLGLLRYFPLAYMYNFQIFKFIIKIKRQFSALSSLKQKK